MIPGLTAHNVFKGDLVVGGGETSPNLTVYHWDNGFGARITTPTGIFPTNGDVYDIAFRSDKKRFYTANRSTNNYDSYRTRRFANGVLDIGSSTMTTPGFAASCDLRTQNDWYGWAHNNSPGVSFKPADIDGFGSGARQAITSYPSGSSVRFSSTGDDVAIGVSQSPYAVVAPFTTAGPGSKYADPSSIPNPTAINEVVWSSTNSQLAIATNDSATNNIQAYRFTPGTGWGTKFTAPASGERPTAAVCGIAFTESNDAIVVAHNSTGFTVISWGWSTAGFGTKFANPSTFPGSTYQSTNKGNVKFTKGSNNVIVGGGTTPYIHAYAWSSGWGTKYSNPSTLPPGRIATLRIV